MSYPSTPVIAAVLLSITTTLTPATPSGCPTCGTSRADTLTILPSVSTIQWRGSDRDLGDDRAAGRLLGGTLVLQGGRLAGGTIAMDLSTSGSSVATIVIAKVDQASDGRYQVAGTLSAHGVTRPVAFVTTARWSDAEHLVTTSDISLDRRALEGGSDGAEPGRGVVEKSTVLRVTVNARRGTVKAVSERPR
jgi:hypothetical protein